MSTVRKGFQSKNINKNKVDKPIIIKTIISKSYCSICYSPLTSCSEITVILLCNVKFLTTFFSNFLSSISQDGKTRTQSYQMYFIPPPLFYLSSHLANVCMFCAVEIVILNTQYNTKRHWGCHFLIFSCFLYSYPNFSYKMMTTCIIFCYQLFMNFQGQKIMHINRFENKTMFITIIKRILNLLFIV